MHLKILHGGTKSPITPSRMEPCVSNFTAKKLKDCFIQMCNKNWLRKIACIFPKFHFVPTRQVSKIRSHLHCSNGYIFVSPIRKKGCADHCEAKYINQWHTQDFLANGNILSATSEHKKKKHTQNLAPWK